MIHRYGFYRNLRALKLYRNPDPSKSRWNRLVIPTNEAAMPSWEKKTSKHAGSPFRSWGYAGSFDGIDDYIEVSAIDENVYSFEAWFKPVINHALIGSDGFLIQSGDASVSVWHDVNRPPVSWSVDIGTGTWRHLISIIDYVNWKVSLYMDGEFIGIKDTTTQTKPSITDIVIGCYRPTARHFNGIIALVRIWNRSLSGDEVQALYDDPQNPPLDGLVLWLDKDTWDWEGGKWRDKSGHGNHGVIYGVSKALPPLEAKFYEAKVVG